MILPRASDPAQVKADFIAVKSPGFRLACTRTMIAVNTQRPDYSIIEYEFAGLTFTHTVFRGWNRDGSNTEGGIAASMWTADWQVVWDTGGLFVGGDVAAFENTAVYLMMVIDGRSAEQVELNLRNLRVVGVSQKAADRILAVG